MTLLEKKKAILFNEISKLIDINEKEMPKGPILNTGIDKKTLIKIINNLQEEKLVKLLTIR